MIHLTQKFAKACLVSLVVVAISLPMTLMAAVAPTVSPLPTIHDGGDLPNCVAIAADGSLYVSSFKGGTIKQLDPTGKLIRQVNQAKIYASAITFALDGTLLAVTDTTVVRMAPNGTIIGTLPKTFGASVSITVDDLGYLYVVDTGASEISVFSPDYQFVKSFGSRGTGNGQLMGANHISFDKVNRQLMVADIQNFRIVFFDLNGNFIKNIGYVQTQMNKPIVPGEFYYPQSVAIEYTKLVPQLVNRIYVADYANMLQVLDPSGTGTPLLFPGTNSNMIGTNGYGDGQFNNPTYALFDQVNGRLLVTSVSGVTVYGIDGGGNPVDTTPPVFTVDALPASVTTPVVTLTGTVEAGATVVVSAAATASPVEFTSATNWKATVSGLQAGANSFVVSAKDAANNAAASQTVSVAYILPAPALAITSAQSITNAATVVVNGTVDAGATVKVKNNANQTEGTAVVSGNNWTYSAALVEGTNTLTVSAQADNTQVASKETTVLLDTIAPKLSVSALSNNSMTAVQVQNISGTVVDAGQVAVLVNNVPVDVISGAFSTAVTLAEGQNQVAVIAADAAGNTVQDLRTISYDGTVPAITIADSTLPDNATTNSALYTISGSISEAAQVTVAGTAVLVDANNSWTSSLDLSVGTNTIEVVATDAVGNTSSVKRTVTYSVAKLDLAITSPAQDYTTTSKTVAFSGTVTNNAGVEVSYSINNGAVVPVAVVNGAYQFSADFATAGTYSVAVSAKDANGQATTSVRTVIYKPAAPVVTPPATQNDKDDDKRKDDKRKDDKRKDNKRKDNKSK